MSSVYIQGERAYIRENAVYTLEDTVNTRVIFSAVKSSQHGHISGDVTYDESVINFGNGMDLQSGKFTTPVSGYYLFSFSGMGYDEDSYLFFDVRMYKNGKPIYYVESYNSMKGNGDGFGHQKCSCANNLR